MVARPHERGRQVRARVLSAGQRKAPGLLALPIAVGLAFYAVFIARTRFRIGEETYFTLFDDAMVSMRYGRNLAAGDGLVWNPGEAPVEGYTNLLWTLWMAVLHLTGVAASKTSLLVMLSGVAVLVATLIVVRAIAEQLVEFRGAVLAAVLLTALCYPLVFWTLRGMEVGLVTLVVCAMVLLALRLEQDFGRRRLLALAGLMAVGLLTRDDVLVPCLVVGAYVLLTVPPHRTRVALVLGGSVLATTVAHEVLRLLYYGAVLPNTYYLKLGGVDLPTRLLEGLRDLHAAGLAGLYGLLAVIAVGLALRTSVPRGAWLLGGVFAAQCGYSVFVGGDAWEWMRIANRYVTPALPLVLILAAMGIDAVLRLRLHGADAWRGSLVAAILAMSGLYALAATAAFRAWPNVAPGVFFLALVGLAAGASPALRGAAPSAGGRAVLSGIAVVLLACLLAGVNGVPWRHWWSSGAWMADEDAYMARYGVAVRSATAPSARTAVVWAGAIPYFSERPAVDLLGKNDTVVAHGPSRRATFQPGHTKWDYDHSIRRLTPELVVQMIPPIFWVGATGPTLERERSLLARGRYEPLTRDGWARSDEPSVGELTCRVALVRRSSSLVDRVRLRRLCRTSVSRRLGPGPG